MSLVRLKQRVRVGVDKDLGLGLYFYKAAALCDTTLDVR